MKHPLIALFLFIFSCSSAIPVKEKDSTVFQFDAPRKVIVPGYTGDMMEPFLSRDGHCLFLITSMSPLSTRIFFMLKGSAILFFNIRERSGV